ncbi:MAG TPA: hypothetical protein VGL56_04485 [Fimbriimonadaceae bacterium]|jgi:hypothetical protein
MFSFESPAQLEKASTTEETISESEQLRRFQFEVPGALDVLRRQFHLDHWERYPASVLANMYDEKEERGNWGVMIYPKEDWNGAFKHSKQITGLNEVVRKTHNLRIVECGSAEEASDILKELAGKYGPASFAVVCGHGTEEAVHFGDNEEELLTKSVAEDQFGKALGDSLKAGSEVCLCSCSTAAEGGIAENISDTSGHTVHGPEVPTNMKSFGARVKGDRVEFHPQYVEGAGRSVNPGQPREQ